ncbi:hypothetical protein PC129_g19307 [Phytophthora cactorum]|uniref:Uncharacterized protein n=1 Tax=Phytophthora cactorum TaxID=29920 RepID=A0A8T1KH09_9STRA|nr:hypothetical protein Pcac1_g5796 [Phytophthora cactorum]KAG2799448.1 hypothetical protein PC112_g20894 [Phytophthora cactorum]KAG2819411.1 hypothetical protein PC111_g11916 [Phytophthora cactorum]KAG2853851.1 hypothetical protein PC113_g13812 [Phytophthora cactorum]KAG2898978.1 hypothetical protein PC114_g14083 [Phytophthora cactorum]
MNHKDGYIQLLSAYRRAKQHGITFTGYPKSKTKPQKGRGISNEIEGRTKHCGFGLVNAMLSSIFIVRIAESGALPPTGVEVEPVTGNSQYWRDVAMTYASGIPAFFTIEGSSQRYTGIDPRLAVLHPPSKLCAIWKDMATEYEECYSRWKQLGTDSVGFAHFCKALDVLYLHDRLQKQPI